MVSSYFAGVTFLFVEAIRGEAAWAMFINNIQIVKVKSFFIRLIKGLITYNKVRSFTKILIFYS
jgi:hypothetical protein